MLLTRRGTLDATFKMILSYSLMHKFFLPHEVMNYTYKLVKKGIVKDCWRDWILFWRTPYSENMDNDIYVLYRKGYLRKICIGDVCGFFSLTNRSLKYLERATL